MIRVGHLTVIDPRGPRTSPSALYDLFLDPDRQYSCAYFRCGDETLAAAQEAKKRHLAAKLVLKPGCDVPNIGSGWGGLALDLAQTDCANVTGITLSNEQLKTARARASAAGLSHRVRFELRDFREEKGQNDRIVSVGMFEHVGRQDYPTFFASVARALRPDGDSIGRVSRPGLPIHGLASTSFRAAIFRRFQKWWQRLKKPGCGLPNDHQLP